MYLREIVVAADPRVVDTFTGGFVGIFGRQTACITELYLFLIRQRVKVECPKIIFLFTSEAVSESVNVLPLRGVHWQFDFERYVAADSDKKKRLILDALQSGLMFVSRRLGWDQQPFEEAYAEAIRRNLTLEGLLTKKWESPGKQHVVRVHFRFDLDCVHLEAVLFQRRSNREIIRRPVASPVSYQDCLRHYGSDGKWVSETVFQLRSSSFQQQQWSVDFSDVLPIKTRTT